MSIFNMTEGEKYHYRTRSDYRKAIKEIREEVEKLNDTTANTRGKIGEITSRNSEDRV